MIFTATFEVKDWSTPECQEEEIKHQIDNIATEWSFNLLSTSFQHEKPVYEQDEEGNWIIGVESFIAP